MEIDTESRPILKYASTGLTQIFLVAIRNYRFALEAKAVKSQSAVYIGGPNVF